MRALGILAALYATASVGATIELQAFDLNRCLHWHMTSDTGGAESEAYRVALARAQSSHSVFSAGAFTRAGGNVEKFGACSFEYKNNKTVFRCLANQDYPFAGAVFETAQSQRFPTVSVLSCVSGCTKGVPHFIHAINQDIPSNPKAFEAAEQKRLSSFRRACGKK
jgi:hypothetical protein